LELHHHPVYYVTVLHVKCTNKFQACNFRLRRIGLVGSLLLSITGPSVFRQTWMEAVASKWSPREHVLHVEHVQGGVQLPHLRLLSHQPLSRLSQMPQHKMVWPLSRLSPMPQIRAPFPSLTFLVRRPLLPLANRQLVVLKSQPEVSPTRTTEKSTLHLATVPRPRPEVVNSPPPVLPTAPRREILPAADRPQEDELPTELLRRHRQVVQMPPLRKTPPLRKPMQLRLRSLERRRISRDRNFMAPTTTAWRESTAMFPTTFSC